MMQLKGPNEIHRETTGEQTKHIPLGIPTAWAFETSNSYYDIKRERWTAKLLNDQSVASKSLQLRASLSPLIHNSPSHILFFSRP